MDIHAVPCLSDNYAWLIEDDASHTAVVVDPSEAAPVEAALAARGLTLVGIWATHHHHDHVGGIAELVRARPGLEVVASRYDVEHARVPHASRAVGDGDTVTHAGVTFAVWEIPAHTLGHVAFVGGGVVFSGDTLFGGGCGRLFEGTAAGMFAALRRIAALPDETRVFCGHEYTRHNLRWAREVEPDNAAVVLRLDAIAGATVPTRLGDEKATNPFVRARSADELAGLRRRKDGWKEPK